MAQGGMLSAIVSGGSTVFATIAFDTAISGSNNGGSTTSLSWTHTCSSNPYRLLIINITGDTVTDDNTAVTYNSVPASLIAKVNPNGATNARWQYLYYLLN